MNVYSFPTFNLMKILLTAEELGAEYQWHILDAMSLEHKTPEHLQRHPLGKVPAVEVDGQFFFESNSICRLLAERNGNRLYGNTPEARARVNQWVDLMTLHIGRQLTVFVFEEFLKPRVMRVVTNKEAVEEAAGFLVAQLPVMEAVLSEHPFLTGAELTIADLVGFSYFQTHEFTSASLADFPAVLDWYARIKSRPAFERAMAQFPKGKLLPFL